MSALCLVVVVGWWDTGIEGTKKHHRVLQDHKAFVPTLRYDHNADRTVYKAGQK